MKLGLFEGYSRSQRRYFALFRRYSLIFQAGFESTWNGRRRRRSASRESNQE